jgi:hypothetical protein
MKSSLLVLLVFALTLRLHTQEKTVLRITATDAVHFIVTDPVGRKTGCDPRGVKRPLIANGIPHSNYSFETVGDIPPPGDSSSAGISLLFEFGPLSQEDQGTYSLQLFGRRVGTYELLCSLESNGNGSVSAKESTAAGVVNVGQVVAYEFMLTEPYDKTIGLVKIIGTKTLRQDLDNSYKLKLLGDLNFYKELSNIVDDFEKHLSRKDETNAIKELKKFQDRITKEYKATPKSHDKRFVTSDALEILSYDLNYLVDQLQGKSKHGRDDDKDKKPKK